MVPTRRFDPHSVVGRCPEQLTIAEQAEFCGLTIALELYSPETTPLRRIAGIGETVEDCIADLAGRGLDPTHHEFVVLKPPY